MTDNKSKKPESKRIIHMDEERKMREIASASPKYGKEVKEMYRKGRMDRRAFERIHYLFYNKPDLMRGDDHQNFLKALTEGRFSEKGEKAVVFLNALSGGKEESKYARDLMKGLADGRNLNGKTEKTELKKLKELRLKDQQEEAAEKTLKETGVTISTKLERDITKNAVEKVTKAKNNNVTLERPPEHLKDCLKKLKELNVKVKDIEAQIEKLNKSNEDGENDKKIKALYAQLDKLDEQIDDQYTEHVKGWRTFMTRTSTQMDRINDLAERTGLDINTVNKITMWILKSQDASDESLKMKGLRIGKQGQVDKDFSEVYIKSIYFDRGKKTGETGESPGLLRIEYEDDNGVKETSTLKDFIALVDAYEAHEIVETLDDLNERIGGHSYFKPLAKGDVFKTKAPKRYDDEEGVQYEEKYFEISKITENKIILDKAVLTLPKEKLPNSVSNVLYFDRYKKEFTFGEFAKFVKQTGYTRKMEEGEDLQTITRKIAEKQIEEALSYAGNNEMREKIANGGLVPSVAAATVPIPQVGKSSNVIWADEFMRRKKAKLTNLGNNEFEVEYREAGADGTLNGAIIPQELRTSDGKGSVGKIRKQKVSGERLAQLANKGAIQADEEEIDEDFSPKQTSDSANREDASEEDIGEKKEKDKVKKKKDKFYEEALPLDMVDKCGGMTIQKRGYFSKLWHETHFMSVGDFWEMGKTMYEYYIRRFERRQKSNYSAIGKELPFFSPEMQRINQAAETEEVNGFKETLEQMGIPAIEHLLETTSNPDHLKAILTTLCEKGQMRWDNIKAWENINKFISNNSKKIPIPTNGDPYTKQSKTDGRTGLDFLEGAIDSLWGDSTYSDWYAQNKSQFASNAKGFEEKGKELENSDGGHAKHLAMLLKKHKQGEYVNPHEYEGLIIHAIVNGKSSLQAKLYYMVEGVAAENQYGKTILSYDRIAHMNAETIANFPMMEYLTEYGVTRPGGGRHTWTKDDFKAWAYDFDGGDTKNPNNCTPNQRVNKFLWEKIIPSDPTQNRINKDLRHGENLDHDDMYAYLPPATSEIITDTCSASTGRKRYLTIEGYANAFPGFSEYMRTLANNNNRQKLVEAVKSYVRFESIMSNRWKKGDDLFQRLGKSTMNSPPIVCKTPPKAFADQMNKMIFDIADAYKDTYPELPNLVKLMHEKTGRLDVKENKQKQNDVQAALEKFDDIFNEIVKSDNGAQLTAIVAGANLEGMPSYLSDAELDKRKADYENKLELDY